MNKYLREKWPFFFFSGYELAEVKQAKTIFHKKEMIYFKVFDTYKVFNEITEKVLFF